MMSLFGHGKKPHERTVLLFDIGSASIGGAIVTYGGEKPLVRYSTRVPIGFQRSINARRFMAAAGTALESVCNRIIADVVRPKAFPFKPEAARCTFSSPWLLSKPVTIKHESDKPFTVSDDFAEKLLAAEEARFAEGFGAGARTKSVGIIERRIIGCTMNGYHVSRINDQRCKEMALHVYLSAASTEATTLFEKTIRSSFHVDEVSFSSFLLAYFSAMRDAHPELENFVCLDITGEVTDILVASRGTVADVSSFPIGANALARTIADQTGMPDESAVSLPPLAATAGSYRDERAGKASKEALAAWSRAIGETFETIGKTTSLPRTLFTAIDADVAPFFITELTEFEYDMLGVTKERFEVVPIAAESLTASLTFAEHVSADPFLAVEALFEARLTDPSELSTW